MKKALFIVLLMPAFALMGCTSRSRATDAATPAPVPAEFAGKMNPLGADAPTTGAGLFKANCELCHGPQGHGDGIAGQSLEPKPRNLVALQQAAGDDYLFWRIYSGKSGTAMVGWNGVLTEEQIWQVVAFIRTLK